MWFSFVKGFNLPCKRVTPPDTARQREYDWDTRLMAQRHHTSCVLHPHAPHVPPCTPHAPPPCPGPIMRGLGGFIHSSCELRHLLRAPLHTYCTAYIQCLCLICPYYKIICIKCTNHLEKRSNLHMSQSNQISEEVVFPEILADTHTCQEPIWFHSSWNIATAFHYRTSSPDVTCDRSNIIEILFCSCFVCTMCTITLNPLMS